MPRVELLACSCGLAPQPDLSLGADASPTAEIEAPPSSLPPSQPTFTKSHLGLESGGSYSNGRVRVKTSPHVLEPFPPSKRNLPVALGQASYCDKPSSPAWHSRLSSQGTLLT